TLLEPDHLALGARSGPGPAGRELKADDAAQPDNGNGRGRGDGPQGDRAATRLARGLEREGGVLERGRTEGAGQRGGGGRERPAVGTAREVRVEQRIFE